MKRVPWETGVGLTWPGFYSQLSRYGKLCCFWRFELFCTWFKTFLLPCFSMGRHWEYFCCFKVIPCGDEQLFHTGKKVDVVHFLCGVFTIFGFLSMCALLLAESASCTFSVLSARKPPHSPSALSGCATWWWSNQRSVTDSAASLCSIFHALLVYFVK